MAAMFKMFVNRVLALALFSALAACNAAPPERPGAAAPPEPTMYRSLASEDAVVDAAAARDMISLYRRNNGLGDLSLDESLQGVARAQARDMARRASLDQSARGSLQARLAAAGVARGAAVENVSAGYHTLAEAFSGWRQSAPHNARMLERRATRMGLATAYAPGAKYKVYWALVLTD